LFLGSNEMEEREREEREEEVSVSVRWCSVISR
jgi:hypothetical protein